MYDLAVSKSDHAATDPRCLIAAADKVHLDPALRLVPNRPVIESIQIKSGAEFPINSGQQVAVECGGYSIPVLSRWQEYLGAPCQVSARGEQTPIPQRPADRPTGGFRLRLIEDTHHT